MKTSLTAVSASLILLMMAACQGCSRSLDRDLVNAANIGDAGEIRTQMIRLPRETCWPSSPLPRSPAAPNPLQNQALLRVASRSLDAASWPARLPYRIVEGLPLMTRSRPSTGFRACHLHCAANFRTLFSRQPFLGRSPALNQELGINLGKGYLERVLKNPFYKGQFLWEGKLYTGTHVPLVSPEQFEKVQQVFRGHNKPRYKSHALGLLTCAYDNCKITAETKKQRYTYYRCTGYRGKCALPYIT
jgi:Recombinase